MHVSSTWDEQDRGGRWVAVQFALIAVTVAAAWAPPGWPDRIQVPLAAFGAVLALLGGFGAVWSWRSLGPAATPFPRPTGSGSLIEHGPYAVVRHPIYAAALVFFTGFGLATSPAVFVPLAALGLLWRNKAALEEEWLEARYPHYAEYRERVRGAFVPRSPGD